jgi:release factor glutamine methyltransferase
MLASAATRLRAAGYRITTPRSTASSRHELGVSQEDILAGRLQPITPEQAQAFEAQVKRREAREPLAYILGRREFWSLEFTVGPGVLVPRPEPNFWSSRPSKPFLIAMCPFVCSTSAPVQDACCSRSCPSGRNAQGLGVDISAAALKVAEQNAANLLLAGRAQFAHSNWFENVVGAFDVIFVNPPYIPHGALDDLPPEVQTYEPRSALDGGPDGLDATATFALGSKSGSLRKAVLSSR